MNENNGYVKAPHDIIRSPRLSANAKVAWLLIAGMPPGQHPTREQWMAMLPCGDKRVWWRAVKELEDAELISVEQCGTKRIYTTENRGCKSTPKGCNFTPNERVQINTERVQINTEEGCKSTPVTHTLLEEQLKNTDDDARVRERLVEDINNPLAVEQCCISLGIDQETYHNLSKLVISDWEFQNVPGSEWTKQHFLAVMRYKVRDFKNAVHRQRQARQQPGQIPGGTQKKNPLADYPVYHKAGS